MSPPRYKMSLMLLKTTILQVLLGIGLLVFPLCVAVGTVMFRFKYAGNVVFVMFMLTSTHSTIEFICILFMVKQYRIYVFKKINSVKTKLFGRQGDYRNRLSSISEILNHRNRVRTSSLSSKHRLTFDA
uniref:G-protein coupled receptors family 1 profile domain-containing protein n=1 Tax=Panagrolaimus davidi TaxID=227884 RepID=A0A914P9S1_9BILA